MARRILAVALALVLLAPAAAPAQQDPFAPLPPPQPTPAPPLPEPDDPFGDSVGRTTLYVIAGALLLGFVAVAVFISRDARRSVPKQDRGRLREEGPHKHERKAKGKARARGRAQKAARRRNR